MIMASPMQKGWDGYKDVTADECPACRRSISGHDEEQAMSCALALGYDPHDFGG